MTHYYSRESGTRDGEFTIMQVNPPGSRSKESLVCRTPRGDMAAHLVTTLNLHPLPVKEPKVLPKVGDRVQLFGVGSMVYTLIGLPNGKRVGLLNSEGHITEDNEHECYDSIEKFNDFFHSARVVK